MKCKVIASSSKGNCYLFEDYILLDIGVSFTELCKSVDISKLKYVLLTHIHGDHFNKSTIAKLYVNNRDIKFLCGIHLRDKLSILMIPAKNIVVLEVGKKYKLQDVIIVPIRLYHDVPNFGYRLLKGNYKHLHITDTAHINGITAKDYDSATIECNHHEEKALELIEAAKQNGEFTHLKGAMNSHLSVQQAVEFVRKNKIKKLIPCHIGSSTKKEVLEYLNEANL